MAYPHLFAFTSVWLIVAPVFLTHICLIEPHFRHRLVVRYQHQGLTLLEVLIVLALVTLLVSVGLPTYANQISRYQLHGATRQVMSDLLIAQKRALSQKFLIQVLFDGRQDYRIWRDVNNNGQIDSDEITRRDTGSYGVHLLSNNNPRFYPSGTVTNLPTIMIKHPALEKKQFRCITISIAGRIKQGRYRK